MERKEPLLFKKFPGLRGKIPWTPILTNVPTPIDRLTELEKELKLPEIGAIYIKRDDKDHNIYGGNKLRKFEFIFADAIKKKKKGIMTFGGIGTNHGLACAIVAKNLRPSLKCEVFLADQPLTWHVQRSLLLYDYFGAKIHYAKGYGALALKGLLFRLIHRKYFLMLPGGSVLLGFGTPLGAVGYMNALIELNEQIEQGILPHLDGIFVACGSTGTAAGLITGIKVLGLNIMVYAVAVSDEMFVNYKSIKKNCNKTIQFLKKRDSTFPDVEVTDDDFKIVSGYLGSEYGVKTIRGQEAVDTVNKLEGKRLSFKLETTYTGKAMAALIDFMSDNDNKSKKILFWNTYNSNDLDNLLREIGFNYNKLPESLHQFYDKKFQCWQITDCPIKTRQNCPAYLNHEYRFWKVTECLLDDEKKNKALNTLKKAIELEDA